MYAPHTVTVYNIDGENVNITVLSGVFLDIAEGTNIMKSGLTTADAATLYIPFSTKGINALTGMEQQYLPPDEYGASGDKSGFWTVKRRGKSSGNNCFFVKGEVVEPDASYADLNDQYDYCYRVSTVDVRDFGSPDMQHLQVGGS